MISEVYHSINGVQESCYLHFVTIKDLPNKLRKSCAKYEMREEFQNDIDAGYCLDAQEVIPAGALKNFKGKDEHYVHTTPCLVWRD